MLGGSFAQEAQSTEQAAAELAKVNAANAAFPDVLAGGPMPFRPLFKRSDGAWVWWCPNLSPTTGRCLDYENRPFACRDYEPGTDRLCVLYEPRIDPPDPRTIALAEECAQLERDHDPHLRERGRPAQSRDGAAIS